MSISFNESLSFSSVTKPNQTKPNQTNTIGVVAADNMCQRRQSSVTVSAGNEFVGGAHRNTVAERDLVSETSTTYLNKGPTSTECEAAASLGMPVYDFFNKSQRHQESFIERLARAENAEAVARFYGTAPISDQEFDARIDLSGTVLRPRDSPIVTITKDTWQSVVASLLMDQSVVSAVLLGCTGLGKSTKIPVFCARETKKTTLLVMPDMTMAFSTAYFLRQAGHSVACLSDLSRTVDADVVATDAATALRLCATSISVIHRGIGVILLDECHAATAPYDVINSLAGYSLKGVKVFRMTATLTSEETATRGIMDSSKLNIIRYSALRYNEWIAGPKNLPWCPGKISQGKWLIMVPDESAIVRQAAEYKRRNIKFFCMSTTADPKMNFRALLDFNQVARPTTAVMMVTPEFSYGYTFDVDYLVDSGFTSFYRMDAKKGVSKEFRTITKAEETQRVGRAGRFGRAATVFLPQSQYGHLSEEHVDHTVRVYMRRLWCSYLNLTVGDDDFELMPVSKARTLLSCRFLPSLFEWFVSDDGAINSRYTAFLSRYFFHHNGTYPGDIPEGFSKVHYDFLRCKSYDHVSCMFPYKTVCGYNRLLLVFCAVLGPAPAVDVETAESSCDESAVPQLDRDLCTQCSDDSSAAAVEEAVAAVNMVRSSSQGHERQVADFNETARSPRHQRMLRGASAPLVGEASETAYGGVTRGVSVSDNLSRDLEVALNDEDTVYKKRGSNSTTVIEITKEKGYDDYNREAVEVLRTVINVPEGYYVPAMAVYQCRVANRSIDALGTPVPLPSHYLSKMKSRGLQMGLYYTPVLSRRIDIDYLVAPSAVERSVRRKMDNVRLFVDQGLDAIYDFHDEFLMYWNKLTLDYQVAQAKMSQQAQRKWLASVFTGGSVETLAKTIERYENECKVLAAFHTDFFRKMHGIYIVPYNATYTSSRHGVPEVSGDASPPAMVRRVSSDAEMHTGYNGGASERSRRVRSWLATVIEPAMINFTLVRADRAYRYKVISQHYAGQVLPLSVAEPGTSVIRKGYCLLAKGGMAYTAAHFFDADFSVPPQRVTHRGETVYLTDAYSAYNAYVTFIDENGGAKFVRYWPEACCGQTDIIKLSLFDSHHLTECSPLIQPRKIYQDELVVLVQALPNPLTRTMDVKVSDPFVLVAQRSGACYGIVEGGPGFSGSVVVSLRDLRPVGVFSRSGVDNNFYFARFSQTIIDY